MIPPTTSSPTISTTSMPSPQMNTPGAAPVGVASQPVANAKWNTQSFASAMRAKAPNGVSSDGTPYAKMSDQDLVNKVVAKYPVYKDQISDYSPISTDSVPSPEMTTPKTPDYADEVAAAQKQGIGEMGDALSRGAKGEEPIEPALSFLGGAADTLGAAATPAISKIASPAISKLADLISNSPAFKEYGKDTMNTDGNDLPTRIATDILNATKAAGLAAGGEKAPSVEDTVNTTKDIASNVKDAVVGTPEEQAAAKVKAQSEEAAQNKAQATAQSKARINIISPKLSPTEMADALAHGKVKNIVSANTKKVTPDFSGDPHMNELDASSKPFINPKASTATENLENIRNGITTTSEYVVKPLLEQNPVPFHFSDLRGYLDNIKPSSALKSDPKALDTFNRIKEESLDTAEDSLRSSQTAGGKTVSGTSDLNDMWEPAKAIDRHISNELGQSTFDTPQYTGVKAAATSMRNAVRQFMSDSLRYPGQMEQLNMFNRDLGDIPRSMRVNMTDEDIANMKQSAPYNLKSTPESESVAGDLDKEMQNLHNLFEVRDNLSVKARLEQGTNALSRYLKNHPLARQAAGAIKLGGVVSAAQHL